jgi:sigma-E factor negative regulatory protein RseB
MRWRGGALAAIGVLGLIGGPAAAAEDDAREWLQRMTEALATRNYFGLFTHATNGQSETMRIVHRVEDGRSSERLLSLDGSGREIVRTEKEVHVYLPDRRVVLVEPRTDAGSLLKALPAPSPQLDALYDLQVRKGNKLLGRDVRILDIRPRDAYRYGYRLWLDEESAMPLRSVVTDPAGRAVEQIHFTRLELPRRIDPSATEPTVDASGFQWIKTGRKPAKAAMAARAAEWRPMKMPPGFRLVGSRVQVMPGVPMPVQHLIFSDGFASVSVFIEPGPSSGPAPPESTSVGSANAYTVTIKDHVVTAVGEVPPETVRDIANSVAPVEPLEPAGNGNPTEPASR